MDSSARIRADEPYGVARPTVTCAVHEIRPLLARRGFSVPQRPGVRRDGTEVHVTTATGIGRRSTSSAKGRSGGRREYYPETHAAIADLVSDRAARRPTLHGTAAELLPVHRTAC
ncbi:hypothetical protein [Streptomyces sp. NPDC059918]|uniref:hypothetical protein n=1 Tax=unclassified Streptomyces TaxID=2593676 RepID=UPI003648C274